MMRMPRCIAVSILVTAFAAPAQAARSDLDALLDGVKVINAPGLPGPVERARRKKLYDGRRRTSRQQEAT